MEKRTSIFADQHDEQVACPFCHKFETELYALFGSQLSTSQYYCRSCRVAFERFKWADDETGEKAKPR